MGGVCGARRRVRAAGSLCLVAVLAMPSGAAAQGHAAAQADAGKDAVPPIVRVAGQNRFQTAVDLTNLLGPSFEEVLLVAADDPVVALVAGPLAVARGAVVLLSGNENLPEATAAVLARDHVTRATVIGGHDRIAATVLEEVLALGVEVKRLEGSAGATDAVAMAALIADLIDARPGGDVYLASVDPDDDEAGLAELLVAATLASREVAPVLLTDRSVLPATTRDAIERLQPARVLAVGSAQILSPDVTAAVRRQQVRVGRLPQAPAQLLAALAADPATAPSAPTSALTTMGDGLALIASHSPSADVLALPAVVAGTGGTLLLVDDAGEGSPVDDVLADLALPRGVIVVGGFSGVDRDTALRLQGAAGLRTVQGKASPDVRGGGGDSLVLLALLLGSVLGAGRGLLRLGRRGVGGPDADPDPQHGHGDHQG